MVETTTVKIALAIVDSIEEFMKNRNLPKSLQKNLYYDTIITYNILVLQD